MFNLLRQHPATWILALGCSIIAVQPTHAQFTTILNLPPDPDIGNSQSIGSDTQLNLADGGSIGNHFDAGEAGVTNTNIEVNIFDGSVGFSFDAFSGSTVNISGGFVDFNFDAKSGSIVNISGGEVGSHFLAETGSTINITGGLVQNGLNANGGSTVNISGGAVGFQFKASSGSTVSFSGGSIGDEFFAQAGSMLNISGGEFRLDGALLNGLETVGNTQAFNVPSGSVLSGILPDGTPFAFSTQDSDLIASGTLTLIAAALPTIDPTVIVLPSNPLPRGVRTGQILVIDDVGVVGDSFSADWDSTVVVVGGQVGDNFEAVGAQVTIASGSFGDHFDAFTNSTVDVFGGSIGDYLDANSGSVVNISGGSVGLESNANSGSEVNISSGLLGSSFNAFGGSVVNISGGFVGGSFDAFTGSVVNISGGLVGNSFQAKGGSVVNISGGSVGDFFDAESGSMVTIAGGDFRLDGVPVSGLDTVGNTLAFDLPADSVLSGTLADGTPFAFSSFDSDTFISGTLTLNAADLPTIGPSEILLPNDPAPLGIRSGQTLTVGDGGATGINFNAGMGSKIEVHAGGLVESNFEAVGAEVTVTGGLIRGGFHAYLGSTVNVSGGVIHNGFRVFSGSIVNFSGGSTGSFEAFSGTTVNISGGAVGNIFRANSGSEVNITGGSIGDNFFAHSDSEVNISGGSVGDDFNANSGSVVNISGGSIGNEFDADSGSVVNISGGSFGDDFDANGGSEVNLLGTEFTLDGVDIIDLLTLNESFTISDRDVTLSGLLADGSPFSFDLNSTNAFGADYFDLAALLTVTLTEPGDFNGDLNVDGFDFLKWQRGFGDNYDANDLADWETNFGSDGTPLAGSSASVPEPSACILLLTALAWLPLVRRR